MAGQGPWNFDQYDQSKSSAELPGGPPWASPTQGSADVAAGEVDFSFTGASPGDAELEVGRPPLVWLAGAGLAAAVGIALGALSRDSPGLAIAGWVLGGPIAIGLVALFTLRDTAAQTRPIYARPGWVRWAYAVCMVLCGIAVVLCAFRIAWWVGTR